LENPGTPKLGTFNLGHNVNDGVGKNPFNLRLFSEKLKHKSNLCIQKCRPTDRQQQASKQLAPRLLDPLVTTSHPCVMADLVPSLTMR
jgi:hypothetical protein